MCLIKQRSMQEGKKYLTKEEQDRMTERGTFRRLPGMTSLSLEIKRKSQTNMSGAPFMADFAHKHEIPPI